MNDKILVVFSGYNQRAVISFLRVVSKYELPFVIISSGPHDTIYDSIYKGNVCYERKIPSLEINNFEPIINCLQSRYPLKNYVFVPSSEALNRVLIANVPYFNDNKVTVPLVNKATYELVSDKYPFRKVCEQAGISTPSECNKLEKLPIVAKPKKYFSTDFKSLYPELIFTEEDKLNFLRSHVSSDYYFEEFVEGESYYLLYYVSKNGDILSFSQRNLIQQPDGKSIIAAEPASIHTSEISARFIRLLKKINFFGLVMVEVRFDGKDYFMIEANPRLWGPSQLFVDAGQKFFERYLIDIGFNINTCTEKRKVDMNLKYFWMGGLKAVHKWGKQPVYHKGVKEDDVRDNLGLFLKDDIYRRSDTMNIYLKELE